jgi:hypothetical protein
MSNTSPICSGSFTVTISQPTALSVASTSTSNVSCFGGSNGAIDITISNGTPPYTYAWTRSGDGFTATSEDLTGISADNYSVTVTDNKGCTASLSDIAITQPTAAVSISGNTTNVSCFNGNDGVIDITATGGTGPYTYNWGGGVTTEDRSALTAGSYSVIATDSKGCTATQSFTVTHPNALQLSVVVTNTACDTEPPVFNGVVNLSVTGGTAPYSYDWDNDGLENPDNDTEDLTGIGPGTYIVIVTDAKGCTATISATVVNLGTDPNSPAGINH